LFRECNGRNQFARVLIIASLILWSVAMFHSTGLFKSCYHHVKQIKSPTFERKLT